MPVLAEVDFVEIGLENLALAPLGIELGCGDRLIDLPSFSIISSASV